MISRSCCLYMRKAVTAVVAIKKTFMKVLYRLTKLVKRSMYLQMNTNRHRSWDLPETTEQLRVFQIFNGSQIIANTWIKSPKRRKIFILSEKIWHPIKQTTGGPWHFCCLPLGVRHVPMLSSHPWGGGRCQPNQINIIHQHIMYLEGALSVEYEGDSVSDKVQELRKLSVIIWLSFRCFLGGLAPRDWGLQAPCYLDKGAQGTMRGKSTFITKPAASTIYRIQPATDWSQWSNTSLNTGVIRTTECCE